MEQIFFIVLLPKVNSALYVFGMQQFNANHINTNCSNLLVPSLMVIIFKKKYLKLISAWT